MADLHPLPAQYGKEILRSEVGSTLHGTGLGVESEDRDEMGLYLEPPESVFLLKPREQYEWRTAVAERHEAKSQPGDLDLVVYSLRKWSNLALQGNPSVLLLLHAPDSRLVITSVAAWKLRSHTEWFASRQAGKRFLGYMERQRQRMSGERGAAGRIRRLPDGEVDWKYAMHMIRLGYQGIEFLETGKLTLPMKNPEADYCRRVRRGELGMDEVLAAAGWLEDELKALTEGGSPLPDDPDRVAVAAFIRQAHIVWWRSRGWT